MKILVRLPNWLGDMIMSAGFLDQIQKTYPGAEISVVAKKGIHELLEYFPGIKHQFVFSKDEFKGLSGLRRFGKFIAQKEQFDLFFCLPDSFSSALMGYATRASRRIGYKNELRNILLTTAYSKPKGLHRVEEYVHLLEQFTGKPCNNILVRLHHTFLRKDHIVVNINSEASSRRLTTSKAVEILNFLRKAVPHPIILIGGPKEQEFVEQVLLLLNDVSGIESVAGKTTLPQLVQILASAQLMLTTDSGPAHLSNALGTDTLVLFGAGNENNTAPYNKSLRSIIRLGKLSCEPCTRNVCVQFKTPQCLELLDSLTIIETVQQKLRM